MRQYNDNKYNYNNKSDINMSIESGLCNTETYFCSNFKSSSIFDLNDEGFWNFIKYLFNL